MSKTFYRKAIAGILVAACSVALLATGLAFADLYEFEYQPLYALLGKLGVATLLAVVLGFMLLLWRASLVLFDRPVRWNIASNALLAAWAALLILILQWMFIETPLTVRFRDKLAGDRPWQGTALANSDFEQFSLARGAANPLLRQQLRAAYERIRVVNPASYGAHPIGKTVDKYAQLYDVDATLLFYLAYVHSFWGEAVSGPVPFAESMTSETIRDLIQIHLPSGFIEARLRGWLISSEFLEDLAGHGFGHKLRYAIHKATLDVSAQPYDLNLLSDVFLVLKEYPDEFPEVLAATSTDPLRLALRSTFLRLREHTLQKPYEQPYSISPLGAEYYSASRDDLKRFGRAAYYLSVADFDFATRVEALLIDYQRDYYISRIGMKQWSQLPDFQTAALLAMTRDVYVPSIGKLAYNLYALPEMNCTPVEFVAGELGSDMASVLENRDRLWRPGSLRNFVGRCRNEITCI